MVDKDKVKLMTQAAMVETKHGDDAYVAENFYASDYISFQIIKGLIGTTILYFCVLGVWIIYHFEELTVTYRIAELFTLGKWLLVIYVLSLAAGVSISMLVHMRGYFRAKKQMRTYREALKGLTRFYRKESGV